METRTIKYKGKWYGLNDIIIKEEPVYFLIWKMPWKKKVKYYISFIGNDSCASLTPFDGTGGVTIVGSVNIETT